MLFYYSQASTLIHSARKGDHMEHVLNAVADGRAVEVQEIVAAAAAFLMSTQPIARHSECASYSSVVMNDNGEETVKDERGIGFRVTRFCNVSELKSLFCHLYKQQTEIAKAYGAMYHAEVETNENGTEVISIFCGTADAEGDGTALFVVSPYNTWVCSRPDVTKSRFETNMAALIAKLPPLTQARE